MKAKLVGAAAGLAAAAALAACSGDSAPPGLEDAPGFAPCEVFSSLCAGDAPQKETFSQATNLAPSSALPAEIKPLLSNNNVGAAWFERRLYVAWRTASHHHPRADARVHVVSSGGDLGKWRLEKTFENGADLREPNLIVLDGKLLLYISVVEPDAAGFKPRSVVMLAREDDGSWSKPREVFDKNALVWRMKVIDGVAYASGYSGLSDLLSGDTSVDAFWLKSDDGVTWREAIAGRPNLFTRGVTETDVTFLEDGAIIVVGRNDLGDVDGTFGAKICRAEADKLSELRCVSSKRKYDSPLVFRHGERVYIVGRRNVTDSGDFDLGAEFLKPHLRLLNYMVDYWKTPKRCALWRVDPQSLAVEHVLDLPTRGDTCFPDLLPLDDNRYLLFDYTSPVDGPDLGWRDGQDGATSIYYGVLTLP